MIDKEGNIRSRKDKFGNPILFYDGLEQTGIDTLKEDIKLLLKDSQASSYGNYFLLNIVEKLNNKFILNEKEEELKKVILDSFNRNDYFSDNEFINKLKSNN